MRTYSEMTREERDREERAHPVHVHRITATQYEAEHLTTHEVRSDFTTAAEAMQWARDYDPDDDEETEQPDRSYTFLEL